MTESNTVPFTPGKRLLPRQIFEMQKQAYLEEATWCPFCSSADIEGDQPDIGNGTAEQCMTCATCRRTWRDHYILNSVTTDDGDEY